MPSDVKLSAKFSVPHIRQEGARFHVTSLCGPIPSRKQFGKSFVVDWCGEPFCEKNLAVVRRCIEYGHDPAELCGSAAAKEWLQSPAGRTALQKDTTP